MAIIYLDPRTLSSEGMSPPGLHARALISRVFVKPTLVRPASLRIGRLGGGEGRQKPKASATTAVDGAERALLFGRYVSQVVARIDRDWVRPRTAPYGTELWDRTASTSHSAARDREFDCRAQITQSRAGAVLEVALLNCDSSPEWQTSLVDAINAASPLPAPPNDSVFARTLVLNFTSAPEHHESSAPTADGTPE